MMPTALTRRAQELAAQGVPFATATVVRVERPTSAKPGNTALVLEDGTIEGFVGGDCAEQSVREYALRSLESGETVTPSPHHPFGAKGVGESANVGSPPAVVNAVVDALEPFGVRHIDMPLTPGRVWQAMQAAGRG